MGEHYVAVAFDKLKWVNEPVRSTTASTAPAALHPLKMSTATHERQRTERQEPRAATTTTRPVRAANEQWYPDHAVLNATKDQLKAMTQFKYN